MPHLLNADCIEPERLHAAFTAAFADYLIGPFMLAPADWPAFLARQAIDLAASRVALDTAGEVDAFAFVAWRDARRARLATMGARPSARGSGIAPALLDELIGRLAAQGVSTLELEVFAQNERALRLYRSRGFEVRHALHGYTMACAASGDGPQTGITEVERSAAMAWLGAAAQRIDGLPLQVTPTCLAASPAPLVAWRAHDAQCVFHVADGATLRIASLVDLDAAQPGARALVRALAGRHPGHTLQVPALQRLDVGGQALRDAGALPQPLHQWLMVTPLPAR